MISEWREGEVIWFDDSSGEGKIHCNETGNSYYIHYSAIKSNSPHKTLEAGADVRFNLYTNLYSSQVNSIFVIPDKDILINVEIDGIDFSDYPDFCDVYIHHAETRDGVPLTEVELDALNEDREFVYELTLSRLY